MVSGADGHVEKQSVRTTRIVLSVLLVIFIFAAIVIVSTQHSELHTFLIVAVILYCGVIIGVSLVCNVNLLRPSPQQTHESYIHFIGFKKCQLCCCSNFSLAFLISILTVFLVIILVVVSGVLAEQVRYGSFLRTEPWIFLVEITLVALFPAIPTAMVAWNRGQAPHVILLDLCILSGSLTGLHMFLEMCGFYAAKFHQARSATVVLPYAQVSNATALAYAIQTQIVDTRDSETPYHQNVFYLPLIFLLSSLFGVLAIFVRQRWCWPEEKKASSQEETRLSPRRYQNSHLGIRVFILLIQNIFIIIILFLILDSNSLHSEREWMSVWSKTSTYWEKWVEYIFVLYFVIIGGIVGICALLTRYVGFIQLSPWSFLSELCLLPILWVSPWGYIAYNRGTTHADILELVLWACAFAGGHTLLELSGLYTQLFHSSYCRDTYELIVRQTTQNNNNNSINTINSLNNNNVKVGKNYVDTEKEKEWKCLPKKIVDFLFLYHYNPAYTVLTLLLVICVVIFFGVIFGVKKQTEETVFIIVILGALSVVCAYVMTDLNFAYLEPQAASSPSSRQNNNNVNDNGKKKRKCCGCCTNIGFRICKCCYREWTLSSIMSIILVFALVGYVILTGAFAVHVRYGVFIRTEFWAFIVEVCMMSTLTTIPVSMISWNRGAKSKELLIESIIVASKFGALHIMLELSGVYQSFYNQQERFNLVIYNSEKQSNSEILQTGPEEIVTESKYADRNERAFLVVMALLFILSAVAVIIMFLYRAVCNRRKMSRQKKEKASERAIDRERNNSENRDAEEEAKKVQDSSLIARLRALLILSIVLCAFLIPILVLGLRQQASFDMCCVNLTYWWSKFALGSVLAAVIVTFVILCFTAMGTRFGGFINVSPWAFFGELIVVMVLSVAPLAFLTYNRGRGHAVIAQDIGVLVLKFGGVHLLLELSGFYATSLGGKFRRDHVAPLPQAGGWIDATENGVSQEPNAGYVSRGSTDEPFLGARNVADEPPRLVGNNKREMIRNDAIEMPLRSQTDSHGEPSEVAVRIHHGTQDTAIQNVSRARNDEAPRSPTNQLPIHGSGRDHFDQAQANGSNIHLHDRQAESEPMILKSTPIRTVNSTI